jgi:dCTP diphosphatase
MKDLEKDIYKYLEERGWDNLKPSDLAKSISIESAELLELFQWKDMTTEEVKSNPEHFEKVKKELADVFIYALDMAVILKLDSEEIIRSKLDEIKRKYPAETMKGDDGSGYIQIKEDHRAPKD